MNSRYSAKKYEAERVRRGTGGVWARGLCGPRRLRTRVYHGKDDDSDLNDIYHNGDYHLHTDYDDDNHHYEDDNGSAEA